MKLLSLYLVPFALATSLTAVALPLAALTHHVPPAHLLVVAQAGLAPEPPADLAALIQQVLQVVTDWKTGGVILALITISNLGANLLKYPAIRDRLQVKPWALPLASSLIAAAGAFGTSLHAAVAITGPAILSAAGSAILAALTIGLGGIGLHEAVNLFNGGKQAERAAGTLIHDAVVKGDTAAQAQLAASYAELQSIGQLPDNQRAQALAAWAQAHPAGQVAPA